MPALTAGGQRTLEVGDERVGHRYARKYTGVAPRGCHGDITRAAVDSARVGDRIEAAPSPGLVPPPGNPRFPLFDGLRGIAVLTILVFHASEFTGRVGLGVGGRAAEVLGSVSPILFFLISGFLLYRPFVAARSGGRAGPRLGRYARRRILRIVPAYWVALTVLAIVPGIVGVFSGDWWRYYGYLQIYARRTDGGGIPVAWTLCVEVSFYVLLPLLSGLVVRLARRGQRAFSFRTELLPLALLALGAVLVQLLAARRHISFLIATSIAGQAVWLCIGMALAVLSVGTEHDPRLSRNGRRPVSSRRSLVDRRRGCLRRADGARARRGPVRAHRRDNAAAARRHNAGADRAHGRGHRGPGAPGGL